MLKLEEKGPIEQLRAMSVYLGGDFYEGLGAARMELDNANGKGFIYTYDLLPGLSVRTYNIHLKNELKIELDGMVNNPLYLLFCIQGHYFHKFKKDLEAERIRRGQNVILCATEDNPNVAILPNNIELKLSVIIVKKEKIAEQELIKRSNLSNILNDIFAKIGNDMPYRYFGGISAETEKYARVLIENKRTDVIGKLLTEASALNTLAAQLDDRDKYMSGKDKFTNLSKEQLERVVVVCDEISRNLSQAHTIESIVKETGLSAKKLQEGFRFLFGVSVAHFVKNLKLEKARELIQTTELNISEVVHEIGIQSQSYFSKIFKEKYGMLPRDYRDSFLSADQSFELSYRSKASFYIGEGEVKNLVETSDKNNRDIGVTGCLIHYKDEFFQLLEGPKQRVLMLFEKIKADPRHYEIELLWKGARNDKIFDDWGLILVSDRVSENIMSNRKVGMDIKTMLSSKATSNASRSMFWQQVRNQIRSKKMISA
ncbi:BLUF domain-containing protein [Pareuzebyella sediminis]|uniref:BLUF domain-containing protein n=1 Tax=Pareuzebyella sediminis TaxID=2607998 RepID=UPI0011ED17D1|nr:BLUF domain-containing protein [Pareuzebyella sediminis]